MTFFGASGKRGKSPMTTEVSKQQLVSWLLKARRVSSRGFTLIELLVSIVMGSIIVSALLYLVTELNRFNGREELLTDTQQNMQRALDFMASDVSESIYVYTTLPAALITELQPDPAFPAAADATPVLAFWRLDPVDTTGLDCDTVAAAQEDECETLLVRHSAYTLVVYLQSANNDDSPIWQGPSRLIRYELSKYTNATTLTQRDGYQDPSLDTTNFATWTAEAGETPDGVAQVLTDHVAAPQTLTGAAISACPDLDGNAATVEYTRTPADSNNFYVCVRAGGSTNTAAAVQGFENRTNQSLIINLTGNAARSANDILTGSSGSAGRLPSLSSEVLIRGVVEEPRE